MVNEDYKTRLEHSREMIDSINAGLLKLLEKRVELVEEIGRLKAENGKEIYINQKIGIARRQSLNISKS